MALIRRRYYVWLARAYLKRWYKTIFTSLLFGGAVFFILAFSLNFYFFPLAQKKIHKIGYIGTYTLANIPSNILSDASYGLTKVTSNGTIVPGAAYKWDIKNGGREYVFYIKKGQYFHDGRELNAYDVPVVFKDVQKKVIDKYTISLTLHDPYAPFLVTVAKPLLENNLAGLGEFKLKNIDVNGGFVRSLTLQDSRDAGLRKIITFYPTETSLKDAYALGSVDQAIGLTDTTLQDSDFKSWTNTSITKSTDYNVLVTLFYNTEDSILSDKKVRQALSYAIPAKFDAGLRAYSPIRPTSIYFSQTPNYGISDLDISKNLLSQDTDAAKKVYELSTTEEFLGVAKIIVASWSKIGIHAKIKVVNELPSSFQMLIYPIKLPVDPDQYTLWHSTGINNISKYKTNKRIDKLLEDGRSTTDVESRISIYTDFQKYLIDDAPATFLYFPQSYTVSRK